MGTTNKKKKLIERSISLPAAQQDILKGRLAKAEIRIYELENNTKKQNGQRSLAHDLIDVFLFIAAVGLAYYSIKRAITS